MRAKRSDPLNEIASAAESSLAMTEVTCMAFKTVIVTGGAGFIGSHLVDALVHRAERVVVIDKVKPPANRKNAMAKYKQLNILDTHLATVFEKEKPDVVFHLAAHIHDRESVKEPVYNAQENILGSLAVFEAARRHVSGRVVFASTGVVYGEQSHLPIAEDAIPQPVTPYAVSKLTAERYLHFYATVYGVSYAALRLSNVYGPRQDSSAESGAVGIFARALLRGKTPMVNNDGQTTRDYIYVDDVVDALIRAAASEVTGVFNVGTGLETSTRTVFETVRREIDVDTQPDVREEVQDVPKHVALDSSLARKTFAWTPRVSFEEGVEKTVAWFREQL